MILVFKHSVEIFWHIFEYVQNIAYRSMTRSAKSGLHSLLCTRQNVTVNKSKLYVSTD